MTVPARIEKISCGGVSFVADCALRVSALVKCRTFFPSFAIASPTLAMVRESRQRCSGRRRVVGRQFLVCGQQHRDAWWQPGAPVSCNPQGGLALV